MDKWFCNHKDCHRKLGVNRLFWYCPEHDPNKRDCISCGKLLRVHNTLNYCNKCLPHSLKHILWPQDPASHRTRTAQWKKENPLKVREQIQKRRAIELDAFVEDVDLNCVWNRDAGLCILCGFPCDKDNWWPEHLLPLSRGGEHSYANVFVSHPECNNEKNNKTLEEYQLFLSLKEV
jgi:5-methylcytosine-specific restriction endonuclease McrA